MVLRCNARPLVCASRSDPSSFMHHRVDDRSFFLSNCAIDHRRSETTLRVARGCVGKIYRYHYEYDSSRFFSASGESNDATPSRRRSRLLSDRCPSIRASEQHEYSPAADGVNAHDRVVLLLWLSHHLVERNLYCSDFVECIRCELSAREPPKRADVCQKCNLYPRLSLVYTTRRRLLSTLAIAGLVYAAYWTISAVRLCDSPAKHVNDTLSVNCEKIFDDVEFFLRMTSLSDYYLLYCCFPERYHYKARSMETINAIPTSIVASVYVALVYNYTLRTIVLDISFEYF